MSNEAPAGQTYTSGYYNHNRWPIQLVVSRYNVTLYLPPGDFIRDNSPQKRKINDPYFDVFVKSGQLAKETSDVPVPLIAVPVVTSAVQPAHDGQSVRAVTEFTTDAKGIRRPVIPQPKPVSEQSINKPAFVGMSMDEAKRLGLIKKVREVPEDYGTPDNNSASPPAKPPPLKIAMDTDQAAKPAPALPAQAAAALPKKDAPVRRELQQQLAQTAAVNEALDSETGFLNVATKNIPTAVGLAQPNVPLVQPVEEGAVDVALPAPDLPGDVPLEAPPEEEIPVPPPTVKPAKVPPRKMKYVCLECNADFKMRQELVGHAKKEHPDKMQVILAPYPMTA